MQDFYREFAAFEGTALVLVDGHKVKHRKTSSFHVQMELDMPDETVRNNYWQKVLGVDSGSDQTAHWEHVAANKQLILEQIQGIVHRLGLLQAGTGSSSFDQALFEQAILLEEGARQDQWLLGS